MERLYGFSAAEALGRISHELLQTEFPQLAARTSTGHCSSMQEWTGELRHRRRDGQRMVVVSHQSLRRDAAEAAPLVTEVNNDVTEERRGREAQQYLASIVDFVRGRHRRQDAGGFRHRLEPAADSNLRLHRREDDRPSDHHVCCRRICCRRRAMILERLRRGERLRHYETVRLRKDGIAIAVSLTISPILERFGRDHRCLEDRA